MASRCRRPRSTARGRVARRAGPPGRGPNHAGPSRHPCAVARGLRI